MHKKPGNDEGENINCSNGKSLNVRTEPSTKGEVIVVWNAVPKYMLTMTPATAGWPSATIITPDMCRTVSW